MSDLADLVQRSSIEMDAAHNTSDDLRATNTPGRELAFARARLSLSLEEISRRTKIGTPYLIAIENDQVAKLPGSFYGRGFLRAYAREVHCDPEDIVRRFGMAAEPHAQSEPPIEDHLQLHAPIDLDDRRTARRLQMVALALLVSGGFYVASGRTIRLPLAPRPAHASTVVLPPPAAPQVVAPAVVGTSAVAPTHVTPPPTSAPLSIDVHSTEQCWLMATADGDRVIYRLLSAGESARIEGREEIVLRVGDASALSYAINGEAGRRLGTAGEAVTIRVTPNNYREFISARPSTDHTNGGT
jgi:cytoskeleton protein RodZ